MEESQRRANLIAEIGQSLQAIREVRSDDISHNELGTVNGFHDAEQFKNSFCDYAESLVMRALHDDVIDSINVLTLEPAVANIKSSIIHVSNTIREIHSTVTNGVNNNQFPNRRASLTEQIAKQTDSLRKKSIAFEQELQMRELKARVDKFSAEELEDRIASLDETIQETQLFANEAKRARDAAQNESVLAGVDKSSAHFSGLHAIHKQYEIFWSAMLAGTTFLAVWAVYYVISFELGRDASIYGSNFYLSSAIIAVADRVVLLSAVAVLLRIVLTKYNAERNLSTIYAHRQKVLDLYSNFEAGIGDDEKNYEAKNQFRLEIARYIFSDPASGYAANVDTAKDTQININPLAQFLGQAGKP